MKAEELTLGDWCFCELNGKPEKVQAIYEDKVMLDYNDLYPYDEIQPIPITSEILVRNGFESTENIFGLKTYKLNDDFILEDRGEKKCLCRSCYKMQPSSTFWVCDIEHVHELQHALRLCGITKEIEP